MSRIARCPTLPLSTVHQPSLLLGHGAVRWDTLPVPVRERVLALWLRLLTEHLARTGEEAVATPTLSSGDTLLPGDGAPQPDGAHP